MVSERLRLVLNRFPGTSAPPFPKFMRANKFLLPTFGTINYLLYVPSFARLPLPFRHYRRNIKVWSTIRNFQVVWGLKMYSNIYNLNEINKNQICHFKYLFNANYHTKLRASFSVNISCSNIFYKDISCWQIILRINRLHSFPVYSNLKKFRTDFSPRLIMQPN